MGFIANVVAHTPILSAWGNAIRDRTVMDFANAAERTAQWVAPPEGAMSYLRDVDSVEFYNGTAWVAFGGATAVPWKRGVRHVMGTDNVITNPSASRLPIAADRNALQLAFTKRLASTRLLCSMFVGIGQSSGAQQLFTAGLTFETAAPFTFQEICRNWNAVGVGQFYLSGVGAEFTGMPAGNYLTDFWISGGAAVVTIQGTIHVIGFTVEEVY